MYTILLTIDAAYEKNEEDVPGYAAALRIIKACVKAETIEQLPDEVMDEFSQSKVCRSACMNLS